MHRLASRRVSRPSRALDRGASWLFIAVLALALLAGACSGDDDAATDPTGTADDGGTTTTDGPVQEGGTLRVGLTVETGGWNPAQDQFSLSSYQVTAAIYDRLIGYDENDEWKPYLAESMEPNDDFTEWVITLRPGIEFHDGTPLDSEVLALNLQQTKDSALLGQVYQAVETIEPIDDLSVRVTMSTPWSSFPHTLTAQPGLIVAPSVFEDGGNRTPVGTGPFVFEEWVQDSHLTVSKNENYWREGFPLLDGIEFRVITDSRTRAAGLESGELDLIEARAAETIVQFEENDSFRVYLDEQGETTEMATAVNTAVPPFDDPNARAAVAYGLDRETVSQVSYAGRFPAANSGPFMEGSPWNQGVEFATYDPDRAAEAVAAYEAEHGEPIAFTITIAPSPTTEELAALIQGMLEELGMAVDVRSVEATTAILNTLGGDFQMVLTDALFGSTHPDREYTFISGANALPPPQLATNFTRSQDEDIDAGLAAARETGDATEQSVAWGQVQEGLARQQAFSYLVHVQVGSIATPEVHDVNEWTFPDGTPGLPQEQNVVSLYQLWLG
jgi:ABC-type transport system substrate-binding protein